MTGLFKIVATWARAGQPSNPFVNVFGYRSVGPVVNEEVNLNASFRSQIMPEIAKAISNVMSAARVEVYNVTNGTGYADFVYTTSLPGIRSGDPLPNFSAWGFQYNRITAGKRNGFKRFGAIAEGDTAGDVAQGAFVTSTLTPLANKLAAPIQFTAVDTWYPDILERKPTGVFPWTSHSILSVSYVRITTQNSRKR